MTVYALAQLTIRDRALYGRYVGGFRCHPEGSPCGDGGARPAGTRDRRAMNDLNETRYNAIGRDYARFRREDPGFRALILRALGDARTVVNVGAGAGSYEPDDRHVVAIEPSDVMAAQRPRHRAPAIRAGAANLPLRDGSVDAAMAILTLHHWDDARERGVRELRRVARGPVVVLTYDPRVSGAMWLMAEYLPEVAALDRAIFPQPEVLAQWLGGRVTVESVLIPRNSPDWMLGAYWAHPERVLDADARAATSGFARMPIPVVQRVVHAVEKDLADGSWDGRHGALRELADYDAGLRLVVGWP
jgi:SAM-dependent methyltransferase